jgi:transcriptional regulator with XRE-family HTH domain
MPEIGERIKVKREQSGMTQEELASKLGYKSKTTIAKIENGTNDIVQSKVRDFAKALNTTIAYLMGWDVDTNQEQPEPRKQCSINRNIEFYDKKMLDTFAQLNDDNKKKSIIYTENLLSNQKLDEELFVNAAHERTDVEVTDEMCKHDDDIMNNPDEWK